MLEPLKVGATSRGFELIEFEDRNGHKCSLQQSSAIDDTERGMEQPGSSMVWLGCDENAYHSQTGEPQSPRMHLSREHVQALMPMLKRWLDDGSFEPQSDPLEELPNGELRDHAEEKANEQLLKED